MRYRVEYKYLISAYTAAVLRSRVLAVMQPDSHSREGSYVINNLYLDDRYDSFYNGKYMGSFQRDKFRLRHYNGDLSFIRLERKHKDGIYAYKDTMQISAEQYQMLKAGDMKFILTEKAPLWKKLALVYRLRGLRPAALYAYKREAFVYGPGNVRVTFDYPPFDAAGEKREHLPLYDPRVNFYGKGGYYPLMLEVKYTGFLPAVIKGLLHALPLAHTEMSKYCLARERGILPYGKI